MTSRGRLEGKRALITGAGAGLGAQMARRFHQEGAEILVNDLDLESAERVAKEVSGAALAADVSDSAAVSAMFERVGGEFGRLDVLVNNAGIAFSGSPELSESFNQRLSQQAQEGMSGGPIETHLDFTIELSDEDWRRMIGVHLDGTFFCSREALKLMSAQNSGCIINMGSIMGTAGGAGAAHYCAAKAGILGFTRSLAREVVSRGIRVNALAPGFIDTNMTASIDAARPMIEASTPMGRFGEPDDIAWAAVYLASDEAKFVTGQTLSPNGGYHMSQ
ncbi:MAG TPA: SDR family oxidoreductase [Myxococcales bacterium]|nr:SDR family oxidoreductase [Myxococcales bacterium]HIL01203.1 SDR family oxidoreductase [Myxococcales bacterium]